MSVRICSMRRSRSLMSRAFSCSCSDCAISRAFANPMIEGVLWVPARKLNSCPPPKMIGSIFVPLLMNRAPMPFGP